MEKIKKLLKVYDLKMLRWEILDLVEGDREKKKVEKLLQEMEGILNGK